MSLQFTSVPPVPRGMNLAGPPLFIDDSYCRWMQDVLVDRPGQLRMRGPLGYWYNSADDSIGLSEGQQIIGACETTISNSTGIPEWRGAVFVANGPSNATLAAQSTGISARVAVNGFMKVFKKVDNVPAIVGTVELPFVLNVQYNYDEKRWVNLTTIDAKAALGGGVWVGVIDDVTNTGSVGASALFFWKGGGQVEVSISNGVWNVGGANPNVITHSSVAGVEPGMFAFHNNGTTERYLGTVVSTTSTSVTLEKNVLARTVTEDKTATPVTVTYRSVRGFVHQYGRGFANYDGGAYLTGGGIGTDAEGLFKAAKLTAGTSLATHYAYVYRNSDYQYVGRILYNGIVSNTQVQLASGANERATTASQFVQNEAYVVVRDDTDGYTNFAVTTAAGGTGTTATLTVASHNFIVGQYITVAGVTPLGYNTASALVTAVTSTTVSYLNSTTGVQTVAGTIRLANDSVGAPINLLNRRPDMVPAKLSLANNTKAPQPAPGIFNSTYAGRQWFANFNTTENIYDANINRVVFSSRDNAENINLCQDASDSIIIPGRENIMGIAGSTSGLLVFLENKTYIIRGTKRSNFALQELYPDGCISTTSIVQVGGGVIWAGKQGIYYYDGATVRNFTSEALGVYYTDGIKGFDLAKNSVYAFVYNNYLIMNFTKWFSNYSLRRWQSAGEFTEDGIVYQDITNNSSVGIVNPTKLCLAIYLPTGAITSFSNFTPRGYMTGIMAANTATNSISPPKGNTGTLFDLRTLFTENVDNEATDGVLKSYYSNDIVYSTSTGTSANGPDFYIETKQYNFSETTLVKWWRKLMFNIKISQGAMMVEFVDVNNQSLVQPVTGSSPVEYNSSDENGFFIVDATQFTWQYYQVLLATWQSIQDTRKSWLEYFTGQEIRYSKWLGIRKTSLGFRVHTLCGFTLFTLAVTNKSLTSNVASLTVADSSSIIVGDNILVNINDAVYDGLWRVLSNNTTTNTVTYDRTYADQPSTAVTDPLHTIGSEVIPEIVAINDWVWGLKPLRSGRNR